MKENRQEKLTPNKYRRIYDTYYEKVNKTKYRWNRPLLCLYGIVWIFCVLLFWSICYIKGADKVIAVPQLVLPWITMINTFFIGKNIRSWTVKWLLVIVFGVLYFAAGYFTTNLAATMIESKTPSFDAAQAMPGIVYAIIGMIPGTFLKRRKSNSLS